SGLTGAWANQMDVTKTVALGLTQIHGGSASNVIPDNVYIGGSLRFFYIGDGKKALVVVKRIADATAQAHECTVEFDPSFERNAVPVVNDASLATQAQQGIEEILSNALKHDVSWFASEPFNEYSTLATTLFAFIGMRNEIYGSGAEHHNNYFDVDDDALIYGVIATSKFAIDFLTK